MLYVIIMHMLQLTHTLILVLLLLHTKLIINNALNFIISNTLLLLGSILASYSLLLHVRTALTL